jgi:hypothetical protein
MNRSNPFAILVDVQDNMFDYSSYVGATEFTINFDPNIIDFGKSVPSTNPARISILELKDSLGGALQVRVDGGKTTLCFPLGYETGEEELRSEPYLTHNWRVFPAAQLLPALIIS